MKSKILTTTILITLVCSFAEAKPKSQNLSSDMDSLGGNAEIAARAQALDPNNKTEVVQRRFVDRYNRVELGLNYGVVGGGDSYYSTQNIGGALDYHFTPRWSAGFRYYRSMNTLTSEGKTVYQDAVNRSKADPYNNYQVPDLDHPIETGLAVVNFYPFYGKLNLMDLGVAHFDVYALAGYGKVNLNSGYADTYTAGGGLGLWWSQHFTSRIEGRYQTYSDRPYSGTRKLDLFVMTLGVGLMI